jgi:uncharacterized protein (UPF0332 family)
MKKPNFLAKLKKEGKLELANPSGEICMSYLEKAENCLKSARLLLGNKLYENSVSMSYYAMYNSLTALLFKAGIKCENHAGSIVLLKKLFGEASLFKIISFAKEERIDKQYYISSKEDFKLAEESAEDMLKKAEIFLVDMKLVISRINNEVIESARKKFNELF